MHFTKILVSLKDGWQEYLERKVRRQGWIIYIEPKRKGINKRAAEELKQLIKAKASTLKQYKNKVKQYRQKRLFQSNRSKFYQDGNSHEESRMPDDEKTRWFWSGILERNVKDNGSADWIHKLAEEMQKQQATEHWSNTNKNQRKNL